MALEANVNPRGRCKAVPASIMARQPPQTEAMELLPLLSVMVLSTLMVYGKSACMPHSVAQALSYQQVASAMMLQLNTARRHVGEVN